MIEYKVITNPEYTSTSKIGLELVPDNPILRFFIASIDVSKFQKLIESILLSKRFGVENARVLFFDEMDWEDKDGLEISDKQLSIYVYDGKSNEIVLDVSIFNKIIYDYGNKLLEMYREDKTLPSTWAADMQEALEKLKIKIDNESLT